MNPQNKTSITRTPARAEGDRPPCHGVPELVCPRDEEGIIEPQPECLSCADVKTCLRKAVEAQGLVQCEPPDSAVSRVSGFLRRWSRRKLAQKGAKPL